MRNEFRVYKLNEDEIANATELGEAFSELLGKLEVLCPAGRALWLAITNLQQASFWAKRAMAENQSP